MSYRTRLLRATGFIFVGLMLTGLVITLNGAITLIGTAIAALAVALFCVRK